MDNKIDEDLLGNEKIEEAIAGLQQSPTEELLAHALTVVRRRMRENGQVIIAVEPNAAADQMKLQAVKTSDGNSWWAVFTSFDEEMKGSGSVMSTFMTDRGNTRRHNQSLESHIDVRQDPDPDHSGKYGTVIY